MFFFFFAITNAICFCMAPYWYNVQRKLFICHLAETITCELEIVSANWHTIIKIKRKRIWKRKKKKQEANRSWSGFTFLWSASCFHISINFCSQFVLSILFLFAFCILCVCHWYCYSVCYCIVSMQTSIGKKEMMHTTISLKYAYASPFYHILLAFSLLHCSFVCLYTNET